MRNRSVKAVIAALAMLATAGPVWAADVVVQLFVSRNKGPWKLAREFKGPSDLGSNKSAALLASCKAAAQSVAVDGTAAGCGELVYEWKIRTQYRVGTDAKGNDIERWVQEPGLYADYEKCSKALASAQRGAAAIRMSGGSSTYAHQTANTVLSGECYTERVPAQ